MSCLLKFLVGEDRHPVIRTTIFNIGKSSPWDEICGKIIPFLSLPDNDDQDQEKYKDGTRYG